MNKYLRFIVFFMLLLLFPIFLAVSEEKTNHVVINEVFYQISNANGLQWFELYNPSTESVDLHGWQMPHKWVWTPFWGFRNLIINPGEYVVVVSYYAEDEEILQFRKEYNISDDVRIVKAHLGIPCKDFEGDNEGYFYLLKYIDEKGNPIKNISPDNSKDGKEVVVDYIQYDGTDSFNSNCSGTIKIVDTKSAFSIARYRSRADTNDMEKDFYVDYSPSPGRANNR